MKQLYDWPGLKSDTAAYVAQSLECQRIKVEHQHPVEKLNPLSVPSWKWEEISMDFISGLPCTSKNNESILVVVDGCAESICD